MFNESRLLDCVAYGSEFGQEFNTRITELRSGHERRNINWTAPLGRYSVIYQNLKEADHVLVKAAHMASHGSAIPFRFKDWSDFQAANQQIGTGTGSAQTLQLVKRYPFGPIELVRQIKKPVIAQIFEDGQPANATVNMNAGVVTITAAPGSIITWTGEFDVPVRFDSDRLDCQPVARTGGRFILSSDVTLTEVRL